MRFLRMKRRPIMEAVGRTSANTDLELENLLCPSAQTSALVDHHNTEAQSSSSLVMPKAGPLNPCQPSSPLHTPVLSSLAQKLQQSDIAPCPAKVITVEAFIHCQGCARRIKKTLSKLEGVNTFHVDTDQHKVTVVGCLTEDEVLQSVRKGIKGTGLWPAARDDKPVSQNPVPP
ncbi:hypothetical protein KP509_10G055100 [Ceratopteris richardii]|uniref:HMA domain-containing protein n=1 Tax=Ceratopteris richardii TaxID=49495 RepID=A0A8T2U198_CERRI|nr:hypothetical protein KP509_10G055100 [Ceratopteris richardii]